MDLIKKKKKIRLSYNIGQTILFTLEEDITVELSDGRSICVSKGFNTDGSSSPWYLRWLLPSLGDFIVAAIVHDYLYNEDTVRGKVFADKEMLRISNEYNNKNVFKVIDNYLRYYAVRAFGKKYFNKKRPPISR